MQDKIVDSNEPELIRTKLIELGWNQSRLTSGDFFFTTHDNYKVAITRKEVGDLMDSIGDTFSGQLEEMLDLYDINILLLEGSWKHVLEGQLIVKGVTTQTWDIVWDYLHRWFAKGFIPELTTSVGHTIHRLNVLYALYQKPYSLSASTHRFTDDRVLAFPSGCRGKTAYAVLEACGSLFEVAKLSTEELDTIPEVGEKRASLIYSHFHKGVT